MIEKAAPLFLALLTSAALATSAAGGELFFEDFESVILGPNVDETFVPEPNAWTGTPPGGWSVDNSGVPGFGTPDDGVTEWAGWSFADKEWWVAVAGDQRRSEFVRGTGVVAIADSDEWDDLPHADSAANGWFDTFMTTPSIAVVAGTTLAISFDSSWRPEFDDNYHQTANVVASFDVGAPLEVLLWESDPTSPDFKDAVPDEEVDLDIPVPAGATEVVLTFGFFDAGNDWWWAIDNIGVDGEVPEPNASLMLVVGASLLLLRQRFRSGPKPTARRRPLPKPCAMPNRAGMKAHSGG